jgi:hypothetical protein
VEAQEKMANPVKPQPNQPLVIATPLQVSPGCFPLGSIESRAAARVLAEAKRPRRNVKLERAICDPLVWLQHHTRTRDSHWREAGAVGPYRPFPDKPYFRPLVELFEAESVVFIEKSRDLMLSWLGVGYFTHAAMTILRRHWSVPSTRMA